jgi:hypothetical protein
MLAPTRRQGEGKGHAMSTDAALASRVRILERFLAQRETHLDRARRGLADARTRIHRLIAAVELMRPVLDASDLQTLDAVLQGEDHPMPDNDNAHLIDELADTRAALADVLAVARKRTP